MTKTPLGAERDDVGCHDGAAGETAVFLGSFPQMRYSQPGSRQVAELHFTVQTLSGT